MSEDRHDYGMMLTVYSVAINIILIIAFGFVFWHVFVRSEWNAGWVACRNNEQVVEIAGASGEGKRK